MMRFKMLIKVSRKDWKDIKHNKQIFLVMILIPLVFTIIFPIFLVIVPLQIMSPEDLLEFEALVNVPGLTGIEAYLYYNMNAMIKPFFVMVPLTVTMAISSDSWAGEKERKTAESLLLLPLSDGELFMAKVLSSLIPGLFITWASGLGLSIIIDIAVYPLVGYLYLPDVDWTFQQFVLTPILAFFSIFLNVWISYRSKDAKSAQQTGGSVVLIMIGFLIGGFLGVTTILTYLFIIILGTVDVIFIFISPKVFSRERIIEKI
ncbi:MAG: ABC transporter permease subunit [Promethearchaeota archaeon]